LHGQLFQRMIFALQCTHQFARSRTRSPIAEPLPLHRKSPWDTAVPPCRHVLRSRSGKGPSWLAESLENTDPSIIPWNAVTPPILRAIRTLFTPLLTEVNQSRGPIWLIVWYWSIPAGILMEQQHFSPLLMPHQHSCLAMPSHSTVSLNEGDHECEETTKELIASQGRLHACCFLGLSLSNCCHSFTCSRSIGLLSLFN